MSPIAQPSLILASTSPYRRELLSRLRMPFDIVSPDVDETPMAAETPPSLAWRLALAKADSVASQFPASIVIGSDQVADLDGQPLGKPGTHENAILQLSRMRGQLVLFHTAVAVVCAENGFQQVELSTVRVHFRDLTDSEIEVYLRTEKPYDCAGSAKSEGLGISLLESIESDDPTALIGLPLIRTSRLLRAAGIPLPGRQ